MKSSSSPGDSSVRTARACCSSFSPKGLRTWVKIPKILDPRLRRQMMREDGGEDGFAHAEFADAPEMPGSAFRPGLEALV